MAAAFSRLLAPLEQKTPGLVRGSRETLIASRPGSHYTGPQRDRAANAGRQGGRAGAAGRRSRCWRGRRRTMADELVTKVFSALGSTAPEPERRLFGQLETVPLADLAQLFAWPRAARDPRPRRSIFHLKAERGSGYLFLEAGRIHGAVFGEASGLFALAQMLSLERGTFESCEHDWPRVGNVALEIGTALLRAREIGNCREPAAVAARSIERFVVRVADAVPIEPGTSDELEPALAAPCRALHAACQELGAALELPGLSSARLANDVWILLLFPEARGQRLSAVLGLRRVAESLWPGTTAEVASGEAAFAGALPSTLAELRAIPEVLGAFVAAGGGELIASSLPKHLTRGRVALAAALVERLLASTRGAGFSAMAAELRFGGQRLVVVRRGAARVGIVALSSASVPGIRQLAVHLAGRLGEAPAARSAEGRSPQPGSARTRTRP